jgi:hypothetical protein
MGMRSNSMTQKARIAHLAGPNATIQNTPPLVTSNKARAKRHLPLLTHPDGAATRFDALRPQRLAASVTVYVEQFSAHPLEADMAELYGPPDGYIDNAGHVHKERQSADDKPVYEVELRPEDGLYPLPYMATRADGSAWEEECAFPNAPEAKARQGFFPDGSRSFEEIFASDGSSGSGTVAPLHGQLREPFWLRRGARATQSFPNGGTMVRESGSQQTHRWRKADSNPRSP